MQTFREYYMERPEGYSTEYTHGLVIRTFFTEEEYETIYRPFFNSMGVDAPVHYMNIRFLPDLENNGGTISVVLLKPDDLEILKLLESHEKVDIVFTIYELSTLEEYKKLVTHVNISLPTYDLINGETDKVIGQLRTTEKALDHFLSKPLTYGRYR